jgi:hypothetical protein
MTSTRQKTVSLWAAGLSMPLLVGLSACSSKPAPTPFKPVASIQEVMQALVDPAADALWESVSSTTTAAGIEDKRPQTEAEWTELRHLAIRLAEASNLLVVPGRPVAHAGRPLEDHHVEGILKADDIQARIAADPAAFAQRAQALQDAAVATLAAIDERSVDRLVQAGGHIDQACEACHLQYWYPNDKRPAVLAAAPAASQ